MMKLVHALCLCLELHCMAGFRDHQYSSVGRAPLKIKVESVDEIYATGQCIVFGSFQERGKARSEWFVLGDEDGARVKEGKTYSMVRARSIRSPDPFALTCQKARVD